jgi:hypothetical protein
MSSYGIKDFEPYGITLADVKRLKLKPGDTLVLYVPNGSPKSGIEHLEQELARAFPDHKYVVVEEPLRLEVVEACEGSPPGVS